MASTLSNATLTVTLSESLTLNGADHGSTKKIQIGGVNEVSKRIMTVATGGTQVYAGASAAAYGTFVTADVKYVRITNLDDTNYNFLIKQIESFYSENSNYKSLVNFIHKIDYDTE